MGDILTTKYYNDNRSDVTKNIESGNTTLFLFSEGKKRSDAEIMATGKKSYVYEVFEDMKDSTGTHRTHVGYGVPK